MDVVHGWWVSRTCPNRLVAKWCSFSLFGIAIDQREVKDQTEDNENPLPCGTGA